MDEYIKREEALALVRPDAPEDEKAAVTIATAKKLVRNIVRRTPAADVVPVVHGRWIEQEKYTFGTMYDCSICGDRILDNGHSWNYCPECGARMDGDDDAKES